MINGVIQHKLQTLDEVLNELGSLGTVQDKQLADDWLTRRAIERDLQVLTEVMIDVCQRIIALEGQTPATSARNAIERCIQLSALQDYDEYPRMVQFRNLVVHHYARVDVSFLVEIVNEHLGDFERFKGDITAYVQNQRD